MLNLNIVLTLCSVTALLVVSTIFGSMSMPTEMGLSILAGALGLALSNIDKISEFSGAGFSAKMKDQLQAVIDKETEQDIPLTETIKEHLNDEEKKILKALFDKNYTWRTLSGISKQASVSESDTWRVLVSLVGKGLVRTTNKNKTGEMIWSLTQIGRVGSSQSAQQIV